jgi:SAM-dependent methyltransferase
VADPALAAFVTALDALATALPPVRRHGDPDELASRLRSLAYRLLLVSLAGRRGGRVTTTEALGAAPAVDTLGIPAEVLADVTECWEAAEPGPDDHVGLGALHEQLLTLRPVLDGGRLRFVPGGTARKTRGAWFTPPALVEHLLDQTLEPALEEADDPSTVTVLDPACGSGAFLVAAVRRIARRGLDHLDRACAVTQVHGVDLDPTAVELARVCLWLELVRPGERVAMPPLPLRVDDALLGAEIGPELDVVVGNPPFLNQLERLTATSAEVSRRLDERSGGVLRAYTDLSAVFLHRSTGWVRDGGRIGLVQPQSVLAARDAAGVRRELARTCALEHLWASDVPVFEVPVLTCAPVLRKGAPQGEVRRSHGPRYQEVPARGVTSGQLDGEWSFLLAAGLGVPELRLATGGTLGDVATCTADFRDQYYGLEPYVREGAECPDGSPLVTSGLVEPAACLWGVRPARFQKRRWQAPVVDVASMPDDAPLSRWAANRLVPKVLVGTQGKVVEAVVDEDGRWLPSVPTITVVAPRDRLWHVLAVLLAPPVAAHAAATYAGTALTMRAIKLSASQVARLPLPTRDDAWDEAASLLRQAQRDPDGRRSLLQQAGRTMCRAYGVEEQPVLGWWSDRLRAVSAGP